MKKYHQAMTLKALGVGMIHLEYLKLLQHLTNSCGLIHYTSQNLRKYLWRWIASNALRELNGAKVREKLAGAAKPW